MKNITQSDRRAFLKRMTKLGMLSFLTSTPWIATREKGVGTDPKKLLEVRPYIQNLTLEGITVMWTTTRNTFSWVEYG